MKSKINGEVNTNVAKRAIDEELSPKEDDGWLHVAASAEHLSAMQVSALFESMVSAVGSLSLFVVQRQVRVKESACWLFKCPQCHRPGWDSWWHCQSCRGEVKKACGGICLYDLLGIDSLFPGLSSNLGPLWSHYGATLWRQLRAGRAAVAWALNLPETHSRDFITFDGLVLMTMLIRLHRPCAGSRLVLIRSNCIGF
jgi:hypothetical protein